MIFSSNMATQVKFQQERLQSPSIMLWTLCSSTALAHSGVQPHFRFSAAVSKQSGHQRHRLVSVENSHLQAQFTPTKILNLFIFLLFSRSFCLKHSSHFTRQSISQGHPVKTAYMLACKLMNKLSW